MEIYPTNQNCVIQSLFFILRKSLMRRQRIDFVSDRSTEEDRWVNKRLIIALVLIEIVLGVILYTHVLDQPEVATFPIYDRFDTGLDGWSYLGGDTGYVLEWVSNTANISGDGNIGHYGMQKVVDLTNWDHSEALLLSFDWRATSHRFSPPGTTSSFLLIEDADTLYPLYQGNLMKEETVDTGWRNYVMNIFAYAYAHPRIRITLYLLDDSNSDWHQTNAYDNIKLSSAT